MPQTMGFGESSNNSRAIIPLRMVEVHSPPAKKAPTKSDTAAAKIACRRASAPVRNYDFHQTPSLFFPLFGHTYVADI